MLPIPEQRNIAIVTACMNAHDGSPTFAITKVSVTDEEAGNGVQYDLAEVELLKRGFEEPFCHFGDHESPSFLHDAVRQYLGLPAASESISNSESEEPECAELSR